MEFICCNSGHILWFNIDGARQLSSHARMLRFEEIEDFVETPEEDALVADLNLLVDELKERERKAKKKKESSNMS